MTNSHVQYPALPGPKITAILEEKSETFSRTERGREHHNNQDIISLFFYPVTLTSVDNQFPDLFGEEG